MKLVRLDLRAFGPFTDTVLDFATERPAVHVIYGANEAGKSSALRAIHDLFYGIPETTADGHVHQLKELRIAALVRDARDRELHVVRRKGRKDTLLDVAGVALPGAEASWLTAGVAEPHFRSFFGLSYASLEHDAKQLLSGAGDLGESLFGVGIGGRGIHDVLTGLASEADAIFRPRGQVQKLNEALALLENARRAEREASVDAKAFQLQVTHIAEAEARERALREHGSTLRAERVRLERVDRILPLLAKRAERLRARATLGDVRLLPQDAAARRASAEATRLEEAARLEQLEQAIARLEADRSGLNIPEQLVAVPPAIIERLRDGIGVHTRARAQLSTARERLARAREALKASARGLPSELLARAESRLDDELTRGIREHALLRSALLRDVEKGARETLAKRAELAVLEAQQAQLSASYERRGGPAALPLLARLSIPARESVEVFLERVATHERELAANEQALRALALEQERITRELDVFARVAALPSEDALTALRAARRAAWGQLRALQSDAKRWQAAFSGAGTGPALLAEIEALTERADELADRLRRELERVAAHERLLAERASCERSLSQLQKTRGELELRQRQTDEAWRALWADSGVEPRTPREMRGFVDEHVSRRGRVERLQTELSVLDAELGRQRSALAAWQDTWAQLLSRVGLGADASASDADVRLLALQEHQQQQLTAYGAERALAELERELNEFEAEATTLAKTHLTVAERTSPEASASLLVARHQRARDNLVRRAAIEQELAQRNGERDAARARGDAAEKQLQELQFAAGVTDLDALRLAEEASAQARKLDTELEALREDLLRAAGGADLAELEREASAASADRVSARLAEIDTELAAQDEQISAAANARGGARAGLDIMRERGAADAAGDHAAQLAVVRGWSERYVHLKLAAAVLRREITRYRDRHKGPIMSAASALFARLTLGAFHAVEADYDGGDEPVLVCVRGDGVGDAATRVKLEGLSSGTRDQLYLALRLASLHELARAQELMPLILDDALVHFDDERARAALSVLGDTADVTQVLFFTHHARLVELAREALPAERLVVHELRSARARARTVA